MGCSSTAVIQKVQKAIGVAADGKWGPISQAALNKTGKTFEYFAGQCTGAVPFATVPSVPGKPVMVPGKPTSAGPAPTKPTVVVSSVPACASDAIVRKVQQAIGVSVDGKWGPLSQTALVKTGKPYSYFSGQCSGSIPVSAVAQQNTVASARVPGKPVVKQDPVAPIEKTRATKGAPVEQTTRATKGSKTTQKEVVKDAETVSIISVEQPNVQTQVEVLQPAVQTQMEVSQPILQTQTEQRIQTQVPSSESVQTISANVPPQCPAGQFYSSSTNRCETNLRTGKRGSQISASSGSGGGRIVVVPGSGQQQTVAEETQELVQERRDLGPLEFEEPQEETKEEAPKESGISMKYLVAGGIVAAVVALFAFTGNKGRR